MRRNNKTATSCVLWLFATLALGACREGEGEERGTERSGLLPVEALGEDGVGVLAGAYNPDTGEVFIVSPVVDAMVEAVGDTGRKIALHHPEVTGEVDAVAGVGYTDVNLSTGDTIDIVGEADTPDDISLIGILAIHPPNWLHDYPETEAQTRFAACDEIWAWEKVQEEEPE